MNISKADMLIKLIQSVLKGTLTIGQAKTQASELGYDERAVDDILDVLARVTL